jgi:hypothetical protein
MAATTTSDEKASSPLLPLVNTMVEDWQPDTGKYRGGSLSFLQLTEDGTGIHVKKTRGNYTKDNSTTFDYEGIATLEVTEDKRVLKIRFTKETKTFCGFDRTVTTKDIDKVTEHEWKDDTIFASLFSGQKFLPLKKI